MGYMFTVFNATFNNISVISWWSVLLVETPEYPEKTTDLPQVIDKLNHINHIMLYTSPWEGFKHNISGDGHRLHRQL